MLFLLSSSSSSLLLLLFSLSSSSSSSSSYYYYCYYHYYYYYYHYYYHYYYYYYYHYSVNNIPYQCDINCAGHFTLDALASRPVACGICATKVFFNHWRISRVVADGLVPIWHQDIWNPHDDVGWSVPLRNPPNLMQQVSWDMMTSSNGNIFRAYWSFVRGIHRSPVNTPHEGQWRGALVFSFIYAWTKSSISKRDTGDLWHHRAHYDVIVMSDQYRFLDNQANGRFHQQGWWQATEGHPRATRGEESRQRTPAYDTTNVFEGR